LGTLMRQSSRLAEATNRKRDGYICDVGPSWSQEMEL
jgi:hypothetical protein